ncbi:hypothetical protein FZEAL_9001 [Fusarium zealandicum]|uniref:Uncharacterized protein n=1 Tax=Fusarium zealandicum TaxID=1053134 RepID=A0A8H4UD89_9HYPO|nr:hypothetical protein FZEAL_9001 [Fusarium zealandicum]
MSLLRNVLRTTTAATIRPLHTTARLRMPYKDSQDRETLRPVSNENTKSGRDEQLAGEHADAAFDPNTTRPEEAAEKTRKQSSKDSRGEDPLNASGANQELSTPMGDEKTIKTKGAGEEISKGGASQRGSGEKKGEPSKLWPDTSKLNGQYHRSEKQLYRRALTVGPALNAQTCPLSTAAEALAKKTDALFLDHLDTGIREGQDPTEDLLWGLWITVIQVVFHIPVKDERLELVGELVKRLKEQDSGRVRIWSGGWNLWGGLPIFGPSMERVRGRSETRLRKL